MNDNYLNVYILGCLIFINYNFNVQIVKIICFVIYVLEWRNFNTTLLLFFKLVYWVAICLIIQLLFNIYNKILTFFLIESELMEIQPTRTVFV